MAKAVIRIGLGVAVGFLACTVGICLALFDQTNFQYSSVIHKTAVSAVTDEYYYFGRHWQDEDQPCGKPRKNPFGGEDFILDHPLCNYAADLHDVPTVEYDDLAKSPQVYDEKVVRVIGRFKTDADLSKPRLYMYSHVSASEKPLEFNSPWSFHTITQLRDFADLNADAHSINASLIIRFLDVSDNPGVLKITNNNPMQMLVLHIEKMNVSADDKK